MFDQASLFTHAEPLSIDGESGSLQYFPHQVAADMAADWFTQLQRGVAWHSERRQMYDTLVDVPRQVASYDLNQGDVLAPIRMAASIAVDLAGCAFDSVGLNLYRDQRDSVAWHNDKLHRVRTGAPIAILSLGATRRMTIRTKRMPRRTMHIDLEPGSVLVMSYQTQLHLDHAILKQRERSGPRISLAFRQRPPTAGQSP